MLESDQSVPSGTSHGMPVPTRIHPPRSTLPSSNWMARGLGGLLRGRLPYRLQTMADRLLQSAGVRYKRLRVGQFTVLVRRTSAWDEAAVSRIIAGRDYARPGHEIRPTDTVIDIGGNIGCFALTAARAASRGRVLVFEPDRDNFNLLSRNVALNRLSNVVVERRAVSGESGTLKLFRGAHGPLHTTIASRLNDAPVADEVPAVTLRQIMDKYDVERCGFLKMNCEGAEYGILYNTPPEYLRRIDRIALEYHATEDKDRVSRELAGYLHLNGFEIFEFSDFVGFDCGYIRGTRRR